MDVKLCERCAESIPADRLVGHTYTRFCSEDCRWRFYYSKNRATLCEYSKQWSKANPDKVAVSLAKGRDKRLVSLKAWKAKNPERVKELRRLSQKRCRDSTYARRKRWADNNPERIRQSRKKWKVNNPDQRAADVRSRQLRKENAQPKWLTLDERRQMRVFYKEAARLTKEKGIPHEVDHIVPIRGKHVCGLHVPWNLQVLTSAENRRKSARC